MSISRKDSVSGLATIRTRNVVEHAGRRPSTDRTAGVVIWGAEVYNDGVLLGLIWEHLPPGFSGDHRISYQPA